MKAHPPGRCLDQTCRACWGSSVNATSPSLFPRPASQVVKLLQEQEYDRQFQQQLRSNLIGGLVYRVNLDEGPPTNNGATRWDPTYCWICGGPCFLLAAARMTRRSEYDNGRVIDGEVVGGGNDVQAHASHRTALH